MHDWLNQFLFRRHRQEPAPAWMIFPVIYAFVFLSHLPLLRLPYFWDEAGYYIPAAYDFFRTGALVPYSTLTNAHPPLPAMYLAYWWTLGGFVPSVTRIAICMVATLALTAVFVLVRRLMNTPVAVATTLLTALYPVWFTQSTLAQADIFAAAGTMWALAYALEELPSMRRGWWATLWFSLAVLSKETAVVTPLALVGWHIWETRRKPAQAAGMQPAECSICGFYKRNTNREIMGSGSVQISTWLLQPARGNRKGRPFALSLQCHRPCSQGMPMTRVDPIVHTIERIPVGTGSLNDLLVEDIENVVHFWHGGGADLQFLGIDPQLPDRSKTGRPFVAC